MQISFVYSTYEVDDDKQDYFLNRTEFLPKPDVVHPKAKRGMLREVGLLPFRSFISR